MSATTTDPEDERPHVPLGKAMPDDEFFALADMTPERIEQAQAWADKRIGPAGRRMLRARRRDSVNADDRQP